MKKMRVAEVRSHSCRSCRRRWRAGVRTRSASFDDACSTRPVGQREARTCPGRLLFVSVSNEKKS